MAEVIPFPNPESPTVTEMQRVAEEVRAAADAVATLIPGLQWPHPATRHAIRAHRTVPREFLLSMIAAVDDLDVPSDRRSARRPHRRRSIHD